MKTRLRTISRVHATYQYKPMLAGMAGKRRAADTHASIGQRGDRGTNAFHAWLETFDDDAPSRIDLSSCQRVEFVDGGVFG